MNYTIKIFFENAKDFHGFCNRVQTSKINKYEFICPKLFSYLDRDKRQKTHIPKN